MTSLRTLAYIVVAAVSMLLAAVQAAAGSAEFETGTLCLDESFVSAAPDTATPTAGR